MAYNKIILEGHLTRDIEMKYSQSGSAIASTGIAVSKKFKKQDGSQGEKTLFVDITAFSRQAEIMNQYLRKGSHVLIDGALSFDTWEKDGSKRSKHSVTVENLQMLGNKEDNSNQNTQNTPQEQQQEYSTNASTQNTKNDLNEQHPNTPMPEIDIDEDSIPF